MDNREKNSTAKRAARELREFARFAEELDWLLRNYSKIDIGRVNQHIDNLEFRSTPPSQEIATYASKNPNIHFLTGALPAILSDESLFPSNEDIAQFSEKVLGLRILRWQKKSKYELIGNIVCNAQLLNDRGLTRLVNALTKIVSGDKSARNIVRNAKAHNMDWNTIIQRLTSEN